MGEIMQNNTRKQIIINPVIMQTAKTLYRGGKYTFASDSTFVRAVMADIVSGIKKAVKK